MANETKTQQNRTSIYAIGAINSQNTEKHLGIKDLVILSRNDKQLMYEYVFKSTKPDENRLWQISAREDVGGIAINDEKKFFYFVKDYLSDQKQLEAGQMPPKLAQDFYVFKHKEDAQKALQELNDKQDKGYNSLYSFMQPYVPKQRLLIIDLIEELAKFVPSAINEMLKDPKAKATFEKNIAKFKQNS